MLIRKLQILEKMYFYLRITFNVPRPSSEIRALNLFKKIPACFCSLACDGGVGEEGHHRKHEFFNRAARGFRLNASSSRCDVVLNSIDGYNSQ